MQRFDPRKAAHIAQLFLEKSGGKIDVLKLIKLMYYAERRSIELRGTPITYDTYCSLNNGPILSKTLNLINADKDDPDVPEDWRRLISERRPDFPGQVNPYHLHLKARDEILSLSKRERTIIDEVWDEFGSFTGPELARKSHELPEWTDPKGSMIPIKYSTVLEKVGISGEEKKIIMENFIG